MKAGKAAFNSSKRGWFLFLSFTSLNNLRPRANCAACEGSPNGSLDWILSIMLNISSWLSNSRSRCFSGTVSPLAYCCSFNVK